MDTLSSGKDLLFTLLLKVCASASLAALLVRWAAFRKVLFTEVRDSDLKVKLMLFLTPALAIGVMLRLIVGYPYRFADLMLEGSFLLGLLGGRVVGPLGGSIVSLPAFFHHEWLATPMAAFAGLVGGLIRQANSQQGGHLEFRAVYVSERPAVRSRDLRGAAACLGRCCRWRVALGWSSAGWRWAMRSKPPVALLLSTRGIGGPLLLLLLATVMAVAVPIKIWNNTRIQMNLEQHQQLLLKARMDALSSQINPHFLFNTLNTVSSLDSLRSRSGARGGPEAEQHPSPPVAQARNVRAAAGRARDSSTIIWISKWPASAAIICRFSSRWTQDTLEAFVPSMLLQPIVENSIKHGLAAKLEGGQITIRTSLLDGRLVIEVEDNGVGIPEERMPQVYVDGIGISNVHERLRVLYGNDFRMDISSREGAGTRIRIEVPELVSEMPASRADAGSAR